MRGSDIFFFQTLTVLQVPDTMAQCRFDMHINKVYDIGSVAFLFLKLNLNMQLF